MSLMKRSEGGLIDMVQSLPNANLANGSLGVNAAARLQTTTAANVSGSIVSGATRAGRASFFGPLGQMQRQIYLAPLLDSLRNQKVLESVKLICIFVN